MKLNRFTRSPRGTVENMEPDSPEYAQLLSGPNVFALSWYTALYAQDVVTAWAALSNTLQLALVQGVLQDNLHLVDRGTTKDDLAASIASGGDEHPAFGDVRALALKQVLRACGDLPADRLAMGSRPRPLGPGLEMVRLFLTDDVTKHPDGSYTFDDGAQARAIGVIVEGESPHTWRVVGIGEHLLLPGWPPTPERVADSSRE